MNREAVKKYIASQPIKAVEVFDLNNLKIKYNDEIKQHHKINVINGDEEVVRAYILTKLVNELEYPLGRIEIEKNYKAGRPHTINSRIDIIVRDSSEKAFLFIELKSPQAYPNNQDQVIEDQLFLLSALEAQDSGQVSYLTLFTVDANENNEFEEEAIVIDRDIANSYNEWSGDRLTLNELPKNYGKAVRQPYIKGGQKDLKTSYTKESLEALQNDLHNVLWGGGSTDDNEIFSSLVNLILAKIQDESEREDGESYKFQSYAYINNNGDVEYESNDELFNRINGLYRDAIRHRLNVTDLNEVNKSYVVDTKKFSLSKLKYTIQQLEPLSFVDGKNSYEGKDILGDFFEGIIREGFKQTKGQFFTPINIVKFMLLGVQADKLAIKKIKENNEIPYLNDPSAGSGTFLIEYMKFITTFLKYKNRNNDAYGPYNKELGTAIDIKDKIHSDWFYPDNRENRWAQTFIYGTETNFNLGTATKVNMILHGDGSSNIFIMDGLASFDKYIKTGAPNALNNSTEDEHYKEVNKDLKVNASFDLILTNPPFSVELDNDTKKTVSKEYLFGNKGNSENLFIERWYQLLRENGRVAAILPDSIFDTTENKYIRLFIYKYFKVKAIVSLPQVTFEPYTSTKTSILFLQKKTSNELAEWNEVWENSSEEYRHLRVRTENILKVYNGSNKSRYKSIKDLSEGQAKDIIVKMLLPYKSLLDEDKTKDELIKEFYVELGELLKVDKDTKNIAGIVNTWWVFSRVSEEINYDIFMAEAKNVGYKRTKRSVKPRPNDLYRTDSDEIIFDDGKHEKILDYLREVKWD